MAKISIEGSATVNHLTSRVEFSKLLVRVEDVDLEQDVDMQLANFDTAAAKILAKVKAKLEEHARKA